MRAMSLYCFLVMEGIKTPECGSSNIRFGREEISKHEQHTPQGSSNKIRGFLVVGSRKTMVTVAAALVVVKCGIVRRLCDIDACADITFLLSLSLFSLSLSLSLSLSSLSPFSSLSQI